MDLLSPSLLGNVHEHLRKSVFGKEPGLDQVISVNRMSRDQLSGGGACLCKMVIHDKVRNSYVAEATVHPNIGPSDFKSCAYTDNCTHQLFATQIYKSLTTFCAQRLLDPNAVSLIFDLDKERVHFQRHLFLSENDEHKLVFERSFVMYVDSENHPVAVYHVKEITDEEATLARKRDLSINLVFVPQHEHETKNENITSSIFKQLEAACANTSWIEGKIEVQQDAYFYRRKEPERTYTRK